VPGETSMDDPAPTYVLPQEPEYHCHDSPTVPRNPPSGDKRTTSPTQMVTEPSTNTVTLTQEVLLHAPSALT
jgi:hypothetical protein